jgi:putative flippase GtrA
MKRKITNSHIISLIRNETYTQAVKYSIVGGLCTGLDFVILFFLTHFVSLNYLISSIISFMSGTVLNYYLCTFWIFKIRLIENHYHEFLYYSIITGIGLGINTLLIWLFTELIGLYFMFSKLLATFVTYWWNFGARKYFLHTIK